MRAMWLATDGNQIELFKNLYELSDFMGYSYPYVAQKIRRKQKICGWEIEKIDVCNKRKQVSFGNLAERVDDLQAKVEELQGIVEILKKKEENRSVLEQWTQKKH